MKPMANHYHDLVNVYANSSSEELRIIILKYSEAFTRDNNMGLAKQASTLHLLIRILFLKSKKLLIVYN